VLEHGDGLEQLCHDGRVEHSHNHPPAIVGISLNQLGKVAPKLQLFERL
jgi:hypothetical protein